MAHAEVGFAAAAGEPTPLEALVGHYEALLNQVFAARPADEDLIYRLLQVRDQIAAAIREGGSPPPLDLANRICLLDKKIKGLSAQISLEGRATLEALRNVAQPPERNWWWRPEPAPDLLWTIFPAVLLTVSVAMVTDFTRRILSADPDGWGIVSIAFQALCALAATSSLTAAGRQWMERLFSLVGIRSRFRPRWKLGTAAALFVLTILVLREWPNLLAWHYNDRAYHYMNSGDLSASLQFFKRAIALDPEMPEVHFNMGVLYEQTYQYDKAMGEYEQTIVADKSHLKAYSSLSRLLILANQPLSALRTATDGAGLVSSDALTTATLRKNLAWAEDQLGFYADAESDAKKALQSADAAPAAYCVLGRIYTHWKKAPEAREAWKSFNEAIHVPNINPTMIEPDCKHLAEEASDEKK
jgi:Tfp pilus assembly protein PilF